MNVSSLTDATWKRVVLAAVVSVAIIFSLRSFASSSDIETQKVQLESARGQHCQKWQTKRVDDQPKVECVKWDQ